MRIATILFTYNRSWHTGQVLESLKNNTMLPEKLYIFQDGLQKREHFDEWNKVNKLIKKVNWCDCETIVADKNKGLADSIVSGINLVFKMFDAIIVLEDDCVTHPQFMEYMIKSLNKYANNDKVYAVNGYGWCVDVSENGTDAYFAGRAGSWGWGTWKNRWEDYAQDYRILGRIKANSQLSEQFHIWGEDLESYLLGNINNTCNSWAVFWSLKVIEKKGYCVTPYNSFVNNIGLDGTGVHCGSGKVSQKLRDLDDREEIILPERVEFPNNYKQEYSLLFSTMSKEQRLEKRNEKLRFYNELLVKWISMLKRNRTTADWFKANNISKVSVWGKGKICDLLLQELTLKVEILSIIESDPQTDFYQEIPVVEIAAVPEGTQLIVVIPVYDIEKIKEKIRNVGCNIKVVGIEELLN